MQKQQNGRTVGIGHIVGRKKPDREQTIDNTTKHKILTAVGQAEQVEIQRKSFCK